jgi:ABC-type sugar transport system substrate-binding protein
MKYPRTRRLLALCASLALCALADLPASAQTPPRARVIGLAVPNLASSFWISSSFGVDDEARILGASTVKLNAGGDANSAQQIAQIQDLVQRKVDVIIIGATNGDAVKAAVEQAVKKGIPVIGLSSPPNSTLLTAVIGADHYDMGRMQAQCLARSLGQKGAVAMMAGPSGQLWADQRALGFKQTLQKDYPAMTVLAENRLGDNRNAALNVAEDWLQRFPALHGIYAATDDMAAGIVSALKSAKAQGAVRVSASNFSPTAQQMLKDGDIACVSIQQTVTQGRVAVRTALDAVAGKPAAEKKIALPALLITQENLRDVDLASVVAPAQYRP